jgi:hypothetical protein
MRFYLQILLLLLMAILMISCQGFQKNKTKEAGIRDLINAKVAEKVEDFRQKRLVICREQVLERAGEKADSIIMATAINRNIIDSISRPTPPPRPLRPPIKSPLDTTPVTPFFPPDTSQ